MTSESTDQNDAIAFLGALSGSPPVETHISLVFVGADTVWKLRRAVRLSFLDFTSLEARRHFALRELALNQPAAPGLYRDVVPLIRGTDGNLTFGDPGQAQDGAVDWVLRMARVPADHFIEHLARSNGLTPPLLDAIADSVAAYHLALPPVRTVEPADAMRLVILGNTKSALDAGLSMDVVRTTATTTPGVRVWMDRATDRLDHLAPWLEGRMQAGFVRRAHGDLHLGNLCIWQNRVVPFDALEFDEAMATIDLGYDLAFLLMDLDHRVGRKQANRVLNRYVARTGDAGLVAGLTLFLSVRALVRAHVEAKRARSALAATYLRAATDYLAPKPAVMIGIGGLQGTGKSTLARGLAPEIGLAPGALILRSDEIRKRLHGAAPEQRLAPEAYGPASDAAVMDRLLADSRIAVAGGHCVIADATFLDASHRTRLEDVALDAGVPFVGLWLDAPLHVLEERLQARTGDASDATIDVLRRSHASFQAAPATGWSMVDATSSEVALAAARGLCADASKRANVL